MNKKKKKGFTLIELIAVIAILAILAAILVPKISGYSDSAKKGKAIADAKIIVNAAAAYNADSDVQIPDAATFAAPTAPAVSLTAVVAPGLVVEAKPSEFATATTLTRLKAIAVAGKSGITLDSSGVVTTP